MEVNAESWQLFTNDCSCLCFFVNRKDAHLFSKDRHLFKKDGGLSGETPGIFASVRVKFQLFIFQFIYSIFFYLFWEGTCIYNKKNQVVKNYLIFSGAEDGAQTRDPQLGRLMLYQLSYFRNFKWAKMDSNHRRRKPADLQSAPFGHSGICPFALD